MDGRTKGEGSRELAGGVRDVQLTKEAQLTHKTKWELFLEGYRSYFNAEFSWPAYIKECKLYYGEFNIHDFIRTYGPDCEADFRRFRRKVLEQKGINRPVAADGEAAPVDASLLEMMVNGDSLRTRMLIRFLTPENRAEKKNMKRSWRSAKKMGFSKREWLKSYVGLPFRVGKPDALDGKYTREEVFALITDAKKRLDEIKAGGGRKEPDRAVREERPRGASPAPEAIKPSAQRPAPERLVPDRQAYAPRREAEADYAPAPEPQSTDTVELPVKAPAERAPQGVSAPPPEPRAEASRRGEPDAGFEPFPPRRPEPERSAREEAKEPEFEPYPPRRAPEPQASPRDENRTAYVDPFAADAAAGSADAANAGFDGLSVFRPTEKFAVDEHFSVPLGARAEAAPRTIHAPERGPDAEFPADHYGPPSSDAEDGGPRDAFPFPPRADGGGPRIRQLTPDEFMRGNARGGDEPSAKPAQLGAQDLRAAIEQQSPKPAPAAAMSAALRFEQHVDEQTRAVKRDNARITQELRRVSEITQSEQERYEALREKRKRLTAELAAAARTAGMAVADGGNRE